MSLKARSEHPDLGLQVLLGTLMRSSVCEDLQEIYQQCRLCTDYMALVRSASSLLCLAMLRSMRCLVIDMNERALDIGQGLQLDLL